MDVEYEKTGPCNCRLQITVPQKEVDDAFAKAYRNLAKSVRIPGFRPGKAPRHVLDLHYGDQVRSDVENDLVRATLSLAIEDKDVPVVATPRIETGELKRGTAFTYTAEMETQPEINLQRYEGLDIATAAVGVTPEDVANELEKLRQQSVQLAPVLDRDYVTPGDLLMADYHGTVGGSPLDGAKAENTLLEIGRDEFLPGISEALMGAKVPSTLDVPIDFPSDHAIAAWRDVKATFHVELKELKKKDLPDLDDDFAKDLGEESLDDLRGKVSKAVKARKDLEAKQAQRKAALEALVEANPFDVPPSMVSEQIDRMIIDAASRVRMMMGPQFNMDDLDIPSLRAKNRDLAEFQVRSGMLLLEVAKKVGIEVQDDEINAEIDKIAAGAGDNAERARAQFNDDQERHHLKYRLLEERTIQHLVDHATGAAGGTEAKAEAEAEADATGQTEAEDETETNAEE